MMIPIAPSAPMKRASKQVSWPRKPEFGLSPSIGSPPLIGPVIDAGAIAEDGEAGELVIATEENELRVMLTGALPVPGKGSREGAEKVPSPLGSPVLVGRLV